MQHYISLYSTKPLVGYFQYKDLFLIRPVINPPAVPFAFSPHPVVAQYRIEANDVTDGVWTKNKWDLLRLAELEKARHLSKNDFDKWIGMHRQINEMRKPRAIAKEISNLLTFYCNGIVTVPTSDKSWAIPVTSVDDGINLSIPVQLGYVQNGESVLTPEQVAQKWHPAERKLGPSGFDPHQHAYYVGHKKNDFLFPEDYENRLDAYFNQEAERQISAYTALASYIKALEVVSDHPTLALVSLAIAIEALMSADSLQSSASRCEDCGTFLDGEKCAKCGSNIYKLRSRFIAFLSQYAGDESIPLYRKLYDIRSSAVHGELLRAEFGDTGFYTSSKEEQDMFLVNAKALCRLAILNWISRGAVTI